MAVTVDFGDEIVFIALAESLNFREEYRLPRSTWEKLPYESRANLLEAIAENWAAGLDERERFDKERPIGRGEGN